MFRREWEELSVTPQKRRRKRRRREYKKRKKSPFKVGVAVGILIGIVIGILIGIGISRLITVSQTSKRNDFVEAIQEMETEVIEVGHGETEIQKLEPKETELREIEPEIIKIEEVKSEEIIAEHTISNSSSDEARNQNMAKAAEIINGETEEGYIVRPGEKFSWLAIVGEPTEEKGFEKSGILVKGQKAEDTGGGVCQVSTAINSAIQKTDQNTDPEYLHVEEHSGKVSYLRPERGDKEATVTFNGNKDFWFISTLTYPIRIKVETDMDKVTVKIEKVTITEKEIPKEES